MLRLEDLAILHRKDLHHPAHIQILPSLQKWIFSLLGIHFNLLISDFKRCTIAEIFLEGAPLFTLSQLLRYRKHEYDPLPSLEKIENEGIKSMVAHMIALNPEDRFRAQEYLRAWYGL